MIPVVNKAGNGYYPASWCNYDSKQWCTAVTVKPGETLTKYQNAAAGTVITEDDILGYWTYIPRYAYRVCRMTGDDPITSLSAPGCPSSIDAPYLFDIVFQKAGTDSCTASTQPIAGSNTKCTPTAAGQWSTHPAFTFGITELNGIWVGKFEVSSSYSINGISDAFDAASLGRVFIKPNQNGFSGQTSRDQFTTAINMGTNGSGTNITPANTQNFSNMNVRKSKNTDWGAIAYMATSIYGRGTSEIRINNCQKSGNYNARTGWAAATADAGATTDCAVNTNDTGAYHTAQGQQASTTDNIYGIYDMSGGNWERVMGIYSDTSGNPRSGRYCSSSSDSSGFNGACDSGSPNPFTYGMNFPEPKYYDLYRQDTIFIDNDFHTDNNRCTYQTCGGQALHETKKSQSVSLDMQSWGSDISLFVVSKYPWFDRGGHSSLGSYAGLFAVNVGHGGANSSIGFRVVASGF
jgi:hypothetical protein